MMTISKNTDGTSGINACGDGSSGKNDASCVCETAVEEARKNLSITRSARKKLRRSHLSRCD